MKKNSLKKIFSFLSIILLLSITQSVNAGTLTWSSCTAIPGTKGQCYNDGTNEGYCFNCNFVIDGTSVTCLDPMLPAAPSGTGCDGPHPEGTRWETTGNCTEATISATTDNHIINKDNIYNNFYISNPINVTYTTPSSDTTGYTPTIENISDDLKDKIEIIDGNGNILNDKITKENIVYVRISKENLNQISNFKLTFKIYYKLNCSSISRGTYVWYCGSGYQRMGTSFTNTDTTSNESGYNYSSIDFSTETGTLKIKKIDAETKNPLSNIEFKLYTDQECLNEVTKINGDAINIVTDENGYAEIPNLLYDTYYLKEVKGSNKYKVLPSPIKVDINAQEINLEIENHPITVTISKKDITQTNELEGALIRITDTTGENTLYEYYSTNTPTTLYFEKGIYILTEIVAPKGYSPVETSLVFSIDEYGNIEMLNLDNAMYKYENNMLIILNEPSKITISKKDYQTGEELSGAILNLTCNNGINETWETTNETKKVQINPGTTCTLTENKSPDGYEIIKTPLNFIVNDDGNIELMETSDVAYLIDKNNIIIFNSAEKIIVPDTGITTYLGIALGTTMVGAGAYIIIKKPKSKF